MQDVDMKGEETEVLDAEEIELPEALDETVSEKAEAINDTPCEDNEESADTEVDYAALAAEDLKVLKAEFRELSGLSDISELENPMRYAALRDLGLSPLEAYLATSRRHKKDNRSHLYATRTVTSTPQGSMSEAELTAAREIFSGVSDAEIRRLYKRVSAK